MDSRKSEGTLVMKLADKLITAIITVNDEKQKTVAIVFELDGESICFPLDAVLVSDTVKSLLDLQSKLDTESSPLSTLFN